MRQQVRLNKETGEKGEEIEPVEVYCLQQNNGQKTSQRY